MVETAEAYIICGTVAGDNPLAAFHYEVLQVYNAFAYVASARFAEGYDGFVDLAGGNGAFAVLKPFGCLLFDFLAAVFAALCAGHQVGEAQLHLFVGDGHAEAEFCEILEEGVCPCGAVAAEIGGVRGRRHGA